jgi:hypothetical protein
MARTRQVSFKIAKRDLLAMDQIVFRAAAMFRRGGVERDDLDIRMDVIATHANGNPLRLHDLAAADDFNFSHDIVGIYRHLNRETGKLENYFRPRFSRPSRSYRPLSRSRLGALRQHATA